MKMRDLTNFERNLITKFAGALEPISRAQLLDDLEKSLANPVVPDGSRTLFEITGYDRPVYRGQHLFPLEGHMLDEDGIELTVLLHADENGRLLELEFVRWDDSSLISPVWDSLRLS